MSVVWASGGDGAEWGDSFNPFGNSCKPQNVRREVTLIPNLDSNKEGYFGSPTSFIDIDDPRISKFQRRYSENGRQCFRDNIKTVEKLIKSGIVMPTGFMVAKAVEKLRKIANGQTNG